VSRARDHNSRRSEKRPGNQRAARFAGETSLNGATVVARFDYRGNICSRELAKIKGGIQDVVGLVGQPAQTNLLLTPQLDPRAGKSERAQLSGIPSRAAINSLRRIAAQAANWDFWSQSLGSTDCPRGSLARAVFAHNLIIQKARSARRFGPNRSSRELISAQAAVSSTRLSPLAASGQEWLETQSI
jgi:hypothetical protein